MGKLPDDHEDFERSFQDMLDGKLPTETPIKMLALAQLEIVETFESAGFARSEALYLTSSMFCGNPGMPPNRSSGG